MRIFVDTSAWISLIAAKEPHHEVVARAWRNLLDRGARAVTSSDVVTETITFLRYHAGYKTAVDFRGLMAQSVEEGRLTLVWVDQDLFERAWRIFRTFEDQELSMVDCTSFALCRREKIGTALTLDRHFQAAGLEVLPREL